jgi:hypothetical protein
LPGWRYFFFSGIDLTGTTLSKGFSKSFGSSEAWISRAISTKRLWAFSLGQFGLGLCLGLPRKYRKELAFIRSEVGQNTIVHGFLLGRLFVEVPADSLARRRRAI